jgi:hypothetical protein
LIPRFGEDVPNRTEFLYARSRHSATADPILDARDVEYDLPLESDSVAWRPEADMLYEAAFEVFAVGGYYYPPASYGFYQ